MFHAIPDLVQDSLAVGLFEFICLDDDLTSFVIYL